eukprot:m.231911 g.231911  ORF g.231911 m.231911 type:complete len:66 (+) comp16013_c0_seq8:810-1007(+)
MGIIAVFLLRSSIVRGQCKQYYAPSENNCDDSGGQDRKQESNVAEHPSKKFLPKQIPYEDLEQQP